MKNNKELEYAIMKKVMKKKFATIIVCVCVSSLSFIPVYFIPEKETGISAIAICTLIFFTVFCVLAFAVNYSMNKYREMYDKNSKHNNTSKIFVPFFANKYAIPVDVIFIFSLVISIVIANYNIPEYLTLFYPTVLILSCGLHIIFNSKNFNLFISYFNN